MYIPSQRRKEGERERDGEEARICQQSIVSVSNGPLEQYESVRISNTQKVKVDTYSDDGNQQRQFLVFRHLSGIA